MKYYRWKDKKDLRIPIGKIICLARTYKKHAEEMRTHIPVDPILFLKPPSAVIFSGESIMYPSLSHCVHHEVELGVVIGKQGNNISKKTALDYVMGYCIALDITARDIQSRAKKEGLPWTIAKGFDTFAPVGDVVNKTEIHDPHQLTLMLRVNDEIRQQDSTANMVWSISELISFISRIMTLEKGDLILTGTPSGVGEIHPGDQLEARLGTISTLNVHVI